MHCTNCLSARNIFYRPPHREPRRVEPSSARALGTPAAGNYKEDTKHWWTWWTREQRRSLYLVENLSNRQNWFSCLSWYPIPFKFLSHLLTLMPRFFGHVSGPNTMPFKKNQNLHFNYIILVSYCCNPQKIKARIYLNGVFRTHTLRVKVNGKEGPGSQRNCTSMLIDFQCTGSQHVVTDLTSW